MVKLDDKGHGAPDFSAFIIGLVVVMVAVIGVIYGAYRFIAWMAK